MKPLSIWCLGPLQVQHNGKPYRSFHSKKAKGLLCYLVLAQRPIARTLLTDLLWPDLPERSGRMNLRRALTNLRNLVGDHLNSNREQVTLNTGDLQIDVLRFSQTVVTTCRGESLSLEEARQLREGLALYKGSFLEGFYLPDCPDFEDWLTAKRTEFERLFLQGMTVLADYYLEQQEYDEVIYYAQQTLQQELWREYNHRQLMAAYFYLGNRTAALAQYETCRHHLAAELDVEPSAETQTLYRRIATAGNKQPHGRLLHHMPLFPEFFTGREQELVDLVALLNDPQVRLLTIVGLGGVGKTRLALELLQQEALIIREAVFVSLADITIPIGSSDVVIQEMVAFIILKQFTAVIAPRETAVAQLLKHLHGRQLILLLDNFEPLLTPTSTPAIVALMQQMLTASNDLKLLVTSRAPLQLRMEWLFDVGGLPLPDLQHGQPDQQLCTPSVQLFVQTARRLDPLFRPESFLLTICEICHFVQGVPLALELAAALTRRHTPSKILSQLKKTFDTLQVDWHDLPERQHSVRATFVYSWSLLSPPATRLLAALSCFQQPFTAATLNAIVGEELTVYLPILQSQSLVTKSEGAFSLHELIREYAGERLAEMRPFGKKIQVAHADYFVSKLTAAAEALTDERLVTTTKELDHILPDIKKGWGWLVHQQDVAVLAKASHSLTHLMISLQRITEGEQMLAAAAHLTLPFVKSGQDHLRELLLFWLYQGRLSIYQLELNKAESLAEQVHNYLPQMEAKNDSTLFAEYNYLKGMIAHHRADWSNARQQLQQAAYHYHQADHIYDEAFTYLQIGNGYFGGRQWGEAQQMMQKVAQLAQTISNVPLEAKALATMAMAYRHDNDFASGDAIHQKAQSLADQVQWPLRDDLVWKIIASEIALEQEDLSTAKRRLDEALRLVGRTMAEPYKDVVFELYGHWYVKQGLYQQAYYYFEQARQLAVDVGKSLQEAQFLLCQSMVAYLEGKPEVLREHVLQLQSLAKRVNSPYFSQRAKNFLGLTNLLVKNEQEALKLFQEVAQTQDDPLELCEAQWGMMMAYAALNELGSAADVAQQSFQSHLFPHLRRKFRSCILADAIYKETIKNRGQLLKCV